MVKEVEHKGTFSWKGIFVAIVIALAIFAVVFIIYVYKSQRIGPTPAELLQPESQGEEDLGKQMLDSCINNCDKCEQNCEDSFYFESSQTKNDESLCNSIENEVLRSECSNNFIYIRALESKDSSICAQLSDEERKSSCIFSVTLKKAVDSGNSEECNSLAENQIQGCLNSFTLQTAINNKDPTLCESLPEEMKNDCLIQIPSQ